MEIGHFSSLSTLFPPFVFRAARDQLWFGGCSCIDSSLPMLPLSYSTFWVFIPTCRWCSMFHSYVGISIAVAKRYSTVCQNDCRLRLIIMCLIQVAIRFPPFPPIPGSIFLSNWGVPGWIRWNQGFFWTRIYYAHIQSGADPDNLHQVQIRYSISAKNSSTSFSRFCSRCFHSFTICSSRSSIFIMLSIFLHSCSCCSIIIIVFHTFPYDYPHVL